MKKLLISFIIVGMIVCLPLFAAGEKYRPPQEKIIRIADQVPSLITPGVWDGQAFSLAGNIYDFLVEIDTDTGLLAPVIATNWSTEDGFIWLITLNDNVRFHDGTPCTAEDVKFTIERTQDPSVGHLKKADFEVVSAVEVVDDYTFNIHLREPRPTFMYQFTDYNMAILSKDYDYARLGERQPMGSGPFVLKEYTPKESALLIKNDDYFDPRYPIVDALEIYLVADIDAKVSMLESDKVDIVTTVTPVVQKRIANNPLLKIVSPYQGQRFISMAVDVPPFDDNRVRLAFKYSLDPAILARSVAQTELNDGFYYNETPIMNMLAEYHEIPLRGRDLNLARSLLREAGYPNGVTVDLYYGNDHPYNMELAQTIKEMAEPAGFTINLKGYTRDIYLSQYWLKVPFSITGWGGRIDPSMLLALAFRSDGPWNESRMKNAAVDALIDKISAEANLAQRNAYYRALQELFYEQGALINVQVPDYIALNVRIKNYRHPLTMLPQYKYMDIDQN